MSNYIIQHKIGLRSDHQYSYLNFMLMNDLLNMRIISLLADASKRVTNIEIRKAYGEFVEFINIIGDLEDYANSFRKLHTTRIELVSLRKLLFNEQGEKCV